MRRWVRVPSRRALLLVQYSSKPKRRWRRSKAERRASRCAPRKETSRPRERLTRFRTDGRQFGSNAKPQPVGPVSNAYRAVDRHTVRRLRQWLCAKHKVQRRGTQRFSEDVLYSQFGLVRLKLRIASRPCATP